MCKKILKGVSGTAVANYSYDACGNITQVSGKETVKYSYDGLNRLVREDNAALNKSYTYSYDAGGNITAKKEYAYTTGTLGAAVKTYNYVYGSNSWKDKLTSWNGQSITYDSYGNVKSYKGATYTWDRLNRLKSCVKSNGTTEYTYNVDGQPEKTELDYGNGMVGTTEREYVNGRLYKESKILTMNGAEIVSATMQYLYRGEEVIGLIYNGDLYYYRKNLQGDIIEIVDEDGNVAATYKYDAWGNWTVSGGDVGTYNSFRYRGYYYDTAIMLYYLKTRWYDPETGRFISPDSINYLDPQSINGLNLYAYCLNNPVMYTDPDGTTAWWEWLVAAFVTTALVVGAVVLTVTTAGTASVALGVISAAVTGAATSSTLSLASSISSGELSLGQFFTDTAIGAVTGIITYGAGEIFSAVGSGIGNALGYLKFNNKFVNSVSGFLSAVEIFSKGVNIVGGISVGIYLDEVINKALNRQDNLVERIKNNIQSTIFSEFLNFIKYIW